MIIISDSKAFSSAHSKHEDYTKSKGQESRENETIWESP